MKIDDAEGVGDFDILAGAGRYFAYALAQAAYIVDVKGVSCGSYFGVATELAVFQVLAGVRVKDREFSLA